MAARVISFLRRAVSRDWSAQDLAEFYRVEAALLQSGLRVSSDRGITDEGDPWFVFCRDDDDEVIIHFARIDGRYLVSMPGYDETVTGTDFQALVRELVERHPVLRPPQRLNKVILHPAALLLLLVSSALLKPGHAEAAGNAVAAPPSDAASAAGKSDPSDHAAHEVHQETAILAAIGYVTAPISVSLAEWVLQPHADAAHDGLGFTHAVALAEPGLDPVAPRSGSFAPDHLTPTFAPIAEGHGSPPTGLPSPMPDIHASGFVPAAHAADTAHVLIDPTPVHVATLPMVDQPVVTDAAALPHTTALDLLFSLPGNETISFPAALPRDLSSALHSSVHMSAHQDAASAPAAVSSAPASDTVSHAAAPTSAADTSAPTSVGSAGSASAAPAATHADAATAVSAPTGGAGAASGTSDAAPAMNHPVDHPAVSLDGVLADLQAFDVTVAHPAVVVASSQVVVYDAAAVAHMPAQVVAETFDFHDGSSISLVGLPAELAHLPVHA